ncbi:hypothetical protein AB0J21_29485 [Streptomyces sp. NPDC049954]|uniref:hypothetical protein n=1 Tax=Streptomyces sp. NPDC049954 TaxID=3155779 RepID=UPI0034451F6C
MEQKQTAPNLPPIGAAADPAFIPGLTLPGQSEGGDSAPGTEPEAERQAERETGTSAGAQAEPATAEPEPGRTAPEDAVPAAPADDAESPEDAVPAKDAEEAPGAPDSGDPEDAGTSSAPDAEFTASDRRGTIAVDRDGVRFTLDDQAAEWRWDEIGAVEYGTSRWGRRLTVTVHTPEKRWYPTDVQAPDKATLERWTEDLDAALDAWFEEE